METTPREVLDDVVRSVCGVEVERLMRLTSGGLNETYRVEVRSGAPVIVRIARRPEPWFLQEERVMAQARAAGVPTPEVLGVAHIEREDAVLSFSILEEVRGRALDVCVSELSASDVERLVMDCGEMLARVHSVPAGDGVRHELCSPGDHVIERAVHVAHEVLGRQAADVVERGAGLLRDHIHTHPAPEVALAHGDGLPKHFMIDDGEIVGVIDWEFAGPAGPAFDLARWEVSARGGLHARSDWLRRGYARVRDPEVAGAGWVPAFAMDWVLEVLGWQNPASRATLERCVGVVARHVERW